VSGSVQLPVNPNSESPVPVWAVRDPNASKVLAPTTAPVLSVMVRTEPSRSPCRYSTVPEPSTWATGVSGCRKVPLKSNNHVEGVADADIVVPMEVWAKGTLSRFQGVGPPNKETHSPTSPSQASSAA
jgi:hypothetical protein